MDTSAKGQAGSGKPQGEGIPTAALLGSVLVEIMEKLELIGSMDAYAQADRILRTEMIAGRQLREYLQNAQEQHPKLRKQKRMEQLKSYRDYGYMRKRWEKYGRYHAQESGWTELMDRLVRFLEPLWDAFCREEVFLYDWMPELERYF